MMNDLLIKAQCMMVVRADDSDPMDILSQAPKLFRDGDMQSLGMFFRKAAIVAAVVSIAFSLMSIILANNPQNVSENKKDIVNKLMIIFVVSCLVIIFNLIKGIFDAAL